MAKKDKDFKYLNKTLTTPRTTEPALPDPKMPEHAPKEPAKEPPKHLG